MSGRLDAFFEFVRRGLIEPLGRLGGLLVAALRSLTAGLWRFRWRVVITAVLVLIVYGLCTHPPFESVRRGEVLARTDALDGSVSVYTSGTVLVLPGIHQVRRYSIRDQVYRPTESASATGPAPFQSVEGLSIGVDLAVRWTVDRARLAQMSKEFPDDISADLVAPAVQGIVYPTFARYSVREIFSQRRTEIQRELIAELKPKFTAMGLVLREVDMGKVDLPPDYRAGMEKLLSEELETEKIHYTLQLKEAQVKQQQLEAEADKVRRQTAAEAAGQEQVIAARAQEETMKHILPFKQKQIEQRQLEAEADKVARIRTAEGAAEARRIEAKGEADSRQKLADAEAYRLDLVGKASAGQMEREGALVARYPLLIQKTLADKLSDKVQVIIAPLPAAGKFIGSSLLGDQSPVNPVDDAAAAVTSQAGAPGDSRPHGDARHRGPGPRRAARRAALERRRAHAAMARRCARDPRRTCRLPEGLRLSSRAGRIPARGRGPAGRALRDRRPRPSRRAALPAREPGIRGTRYQLRRGVSQGRAAASHNRRALRRHSPNGRAARRSGLRQHGPSRRFRSALGSRRAVRRSHARISSATAECESATTANCFIAFWRSPRRSRRSAHAQSSASRGPIASIRIWAPSRAQPSTLNAPGCSSRSKTAN